MVDTSNIQAEGLLDDAKGHLKDAVGGLTNDAELQVRGKAEQLAGHAKSEFADLYDEHESKVEAATTFIQERPLVSLAIASLVGLIIGRLILKRRQ